jgi:hypothetical protein
MRKLEGEAAVRHAKATGAQLYYQDKPVSVAEAAQHLVDHPGGLSCEVLPPTQSAPPSPRLAQKGCP